MGERMRPVDELARLWNDTRMRMRQSLWLWPLLAAAAGALVIVIGVAISEWSAEGDTDAA